MTLQSGTGITGQRRQRSPQHDREVKLWLYTFEQIYQLVWKDYSVGDIKNIIWCLVKRLRKKLNVVEDGAGNCIVSVRDIGYKIELNNENEQQ
ncbi:winged helix-turn-helix domain-containing protein [Hominisplanchenecus faecis]|uniref:winged helix-turn-helix domain-containing protein n=1 Tax=Hominisplanchenecus faecis TaxID=2885351 RepID=UPI002FE6EE2F